MIQPRIDSQYYRTDFVENEYKIEQIGCEKLGEIIERGDYGVLPDSEDYCEKGVPLIRGTNLRDLTIDDKEVIRVPKDYLTSKSEIQHRDILILIKGATIDAEWSVAIVPNIRESMIYNGSIFRVRVKTGYDPYYITAFMSTKYFLLQRTRAISNTGIYYNDKNSLENFMIAIPSPEIQKYIGDKVRRAEELREEAKAAKKDYEYIIQDIYYDSNIIKFPKGFYTVQSHDFDDKHLRIDSNFYNPLYKNGRLNSYKNVKLSKLVDLKKNCKIQAEEEYAYFEIGDLSTSNILDGKERVKGSELPGRAKLKLEKDDIIVSLVQESIEVTSYVDKELNNTLTTNGCAVLIPRDKSLSGYLYAIISSKYFIAQKCRYISGTNIRSMSKDDLLDMKIPIVEDEIITKVNGLVLKEFTCLRESKQLILEAKQDVEDLIEGKFDMSKLNNDSSTESRC
jgi:type I restriction enzyme S subunit